MTEARPIAALPIELAPPDISPWRRGNRGVDFVHVLDSGRPGPNVMLQALTHGNELCGALALVHLFEQGVAPVRGTLTLVFANVDAYARFDPADPHPSRFADEDLNRVWADEVLFGARDSSELRRARALQPFVDAADLLLDIHSMSVPADLLIDTGQAAGLRMIERGGFGDPASPKRALLIECGQHWESAAEDVAIDTLMRFSAHTGVVDRDWALARTRRVAPPKQQVVRVTEGVVARSMAFEFLVPVVGLGVVQQAGTPIARDGDHTWLAPYDNTVLVMPSLAHLKPGSTVARLGRFEPVETLKSG